MNHLLFVVWGKEGILQLLHLLMYNFWQEIKSPATWCYSVREEERLADDQPSFLTNVQVIKLEPREDDAAQAIARSKKGDVPLRTDEKRRYPRTS